MTMKKGPSPASVSLSFLGVSLLTSLTPYITPGLDFGAGLTRGLQDALTGGDLFTEILSVLGSAGTTATVVAPCPFC